MFERTRKYPAAVVDFYADTKGSIDHALGWLVGQRKVLGGQVTVWAPTQRNFSNNRQLADLSSTAGVVTITPRTRYNAGWSGGVVLAAWPTADALAELAEDPRVWALCVLASTEDAVRAWRRAAHPEVLGDPGCLAIDDADAPGALDPVVVEAMKTVTNIVNHNNSLTGYSRDAAAQALLMLHDGHFPLPAEEIYVWAIEHGWGALGASRLRDLVKQVERGSRPRITDRQLRSDALAQWRLAASRAEEV